MAIFTYLDASGSAKSQSARVVSMGGLVGHERAWAAFESEWAEMLTASGVTALHMKDFSHFHGEFEGWREQPERRAALLRDASALVHKHNLRTVGATLDLDAYRWFNERFFVAERAGTPYLITALMAIAATLDWVEKHGITEAPLFFFEKGDNEQASLRSFIVDRWGDWIPEPVFLSKKVAQGNAVQYLVPFQAADFVAYETAKSMDDMLRKQKIDGRMSIRGLIPPGADRRLWRILNRHVMWNVIKNQGVPPRQGHAIPMVPDGPLCFVGLDNPIPNTKPWHN